MFQKTDFLPFVGIGGAYRFHSRFHVTLELRGHFGVRATNLLEEEDEKGFNNYSFSALVGLRWGSRPLPASLRDSDGDGLADARDACPETAGSERVQGCPDRDEDGVPEYHPERETDRCPEAKGASELRGCPDRDRDGVADVDDACPEQPGTLAGCPDRDGDGVADREDQCPDSAGDRDHPTRKGCLLDRDGDGIGDEDDACPDQAVTTEGARQRVFRRDGQEYRGCPDGDGDRVIDRFDRCPAKPESRQSHEDGDGCPAQALPPPIARVFGKNPARAQILARARIDDPTGALAQPGRAALERALQPVLDAMRACPALRLELRGSPHRTLGDKARAQAVQAYLLQGLGESARARIDVAGVPLARPREHVEIRVAPLLDGDQPAPCGN